MLSEYSMNKSCPFLCYTLWLAFLGSFLIDIFEVYGLNYLDLFFCIWENIFVDLNSLYCVLLAELACKNCKDYSFYCAACKSADSFLWGALFVLKLEKISGLSLKGSFLPMSFHAFIIKFDLNAFISFSSKMEFRYWYPSWDDLIGL